MKDQDILSRAFDFYLENQDSFVLEYNGKHIVLVETVEGFEVAGSYDEGHVAVLETKKNYPLGTFLVQKVSPGTADYTMSLPARMRLTYY